MQRKQQVGECWVHVIFFACVCEGASDLTTTFDDPKFLRHLFHVHRVLPRGVPRGAKYAPPLVTCSAPNLLFWAVFAILADFSIFSGFVN
jgi:hypothetical protein